MGRAPALAVYDTRDDAVWIMHSKAAHQIYSIFVGSDRRRVAAFEVEVEFRGSSSPPAQDQMGVGVALLDRDVDFLQQAFEAVPCGRGRWWLGLPIHA